MASYWLIGPEGTYAQVEGAARRDLFIDLGWTASDEPDRNGRVWLRHSVTRAYAHFSAESLEGWHAIGWEFAVPPIRRTEQGPEALIPADPEYVEPQPASTTKPKAEAEDVKEKKSA